MSKQQTQLIDPTPVSPIYYVPKGWMVRLYTDGWHCTCGGGPENECEHIPQAKEMHKEAKAVAKAETE